MKVRCAIIDDEFLAREYLKDYVGKTPFLELVGDFNSPLKVIPLLKERKVDLLFLDINMPDVSGLDFLKSLENRPYVILTTAYKEFALEGYEYNVTDYLLKPFSFERFLKAVNKVLDQVEMKQNSATSSENRQHQDEPQIHDNYIIIRADRKYYKINYEDLIYIEGQKAYVTFYTRQQQITALASLKELEKNLPSNQFIRIHKSYIVSLDKIASLDGDSVEIARKNLPIGKNYHNLVKDKFHLND